MRALLVASLLALVVVQDRPRAEPQSPRDGRMIVIVGESGESVPSPRLIVMDADGAHARMRLGYVYHASLSPDARSFAYDRIAVLRGRAIREIWIAPVEGFGEGRRVVRDGQEGDWSPRGGAVAFVRGRNLWVDDLRSRKQRRVLRNGETPDWSPDGKKLAFVRGSDVWVVDIATKIARRLIRHGYDPRWSPDGDRIAFVRERGGEPFVYVARADGLAPRRVAEGDSEAWSPHGRELAITEFNWVMRVRRDGTHRRVAYAPKDGCPACRDVDWSR